MSSNVVNAGLLDQYVTITMSMPAMALCVAVAVFSVAMVVMWSTKHHQPVVLQHLAEADIKLPSPLKRSKSSDGKLKPAEQAFAYSKQQSRFEEENKRQKSSEYTGRGQIWSKHASWHLPLAARDTFAISKSYARGMEPIREILNKYNIDMVHGFLPAEAPLQRLPYARYHVWEDLGDDLPKLLGARLGQARGPLQQLPVVDTDKLTTDAELRRAHLLLCLFAHAYVFGGNEPLDVLPEGIAVPLCAVAEKLGIPPVLSHPSIVLYNWQKLDSEAAICMENLCTLNNFFDGRDESWFYLITVEVEAKGAQAIVPTLLAIDAISRYSEEQRRPAEAMDFSEPPGVFDTTSSSDSVEEEENTSDHCDGAAASSDDEVESLASDRNAPAIKAVRYEALLGQLSTERVARYVTKQLQRIASAIHAMGTSISAMREGCHPFIFYHRVRPFLSGWKHNPTLPHGVLYTGVSTERKQYYGGSAAQSALLPLLDIGLGVKHDSAKSQDFLLAMRDYMLKPHREFLVYLGQVANIREFVSELKERYLAADPVCVDDVVPGEGETQPRTTAAVRLLVVQYDRCVANLRDFRTIHMSLVADYIMAQQRGPPKMTDTAVETTQRAGDTAATEITTTHTTATSTTAEQRAAAETADKVSDYQVSRRMQLPRGHSSQPPHRRALMQDSAGGRGTGGTDLMNFLRPIRDDCKASLLSGTATPAKLAAKTSNEPDGRSYAGTSLTQPIASTSAEPASKVSAAEPAASPGLGAMAGSATDVYYKDNGSCADIDLYRGASGVARASLSDVNSCYTSASVPSATTATSTSFPEVRVDA